MCGVGSGAVLLLRLVLEVLLRLPVVRLLVLLLLVIGLHLRILCVLLRRVGRCEARRRGEQRQGLKNRAPTLFFTLFLIFFLILHILRVLLAENIYFSFQKKFFPCLCNRKRHNVDDDVITAVMSV